MTDPIIIAVDPGDEHVGLAWYDSADDHIATAEVPSAEAVRVIEKILIGYHEDDRFPVLVIEKFVLYPHSAGSQSWSPMKTSEMIGALKYIAIRRRVLVREQGADIKKPMRRQLRARGIRLNPLPRGATGDHARDAELHLWYYLLTNRIVDTRGAA